MNEENLTGAESRLLINDKLRLKVEHVPIGDLQGFGRNPRKHNRQHSQALRKSITMFGFVMPILVDERSRIVAGAARVAAARDLGMAKVPAIRIGHLSDAELRAFRIADNRLVELGDWDQEVLAIEFRELLEIDYEVELTGFQMPEIDILLESQRPREQEAPLEIHDGPPVTNPGDLWHLNGHQIFCGDARNQCQLDQLMSGEAADLVFTDPPYNVPIQGHVSGLGATHHREFAMASGEMTREAFGGFLRDFLGTAREASRPGALFYVCMDWRSATLLQSVAESVELELVAWPVWAKTNAGMGSFYRSQHEFVLVFRERGKRHRNNVQLGIFGRHRSNLWTYEGANTLRGPRRADLQDHPTPKPVDMVADAILDCTTPHQVVLDPFLGGGATLIACERTGRRCRGVEIDPRYVDAAIRRWQRMSGGTARNAKTGLTFEEVANGHAPILGLPAPVEEI